MSPSNLIKFLFNIEAYAYNESEIGSYVKLAIILGNLILFLPTFNAENN